MGLGIGTRDMCGPCPCVYRYRFVKGHGTKGLGICMVPVHSCKDVDISAFSIENRSLC